MTTVVGPNIRELTRAEAEAFLLTQSIGRIAFAPHDKVDVEPVNFAYANGCVYGRTSPGAKLLALAHNAWCAFEVDEAKALFDWQSVVVKGPFEALNSSIARSENFDKAVEAFRRIVPQAFAEGDPTPERDVMFAIHAREIDGRASTSGPRDV